MSVPSLQMIKYEKICTLLETCIALTDMKRFAIAANIDEIINIFVAIDLGHSSTEKFDKMLQNANGNVLYFVAMKMCIINNIAGKIKYLTKSADKDCVFAINSLGIHFFKHDDVNLAITLFNRAISLGCKESYIWLAYCYNSLNNIEIIDECCENAYIYKNTTTALNIAKLYKSRNNLAKAKHWFNIAQTVDKNVNAVNELMMLDLGSTKCTEKQKTIEAYLANVAKSGCGDVAYYLATRHHNNKNYIKAVEYFRMALPITYEDFTMINRGINMYCSLFVTPMESVKYYIMIVNNRYDMSYFFLGKILETYQEPLMHNLKISYIRKAIKNGNLDILSLISHNTHKFSFFDPEGNTKMMMSAVSKIKYLESLYNNTEHDATINAVVYKKRIFFNTEILEYYCGKYFEIRKNYPEAIKRYKKSIITSPLPINRLVAIDLCNAMLKNNDTDKATELFLQIVKDLEKDLEIVGEHATDKIIDHFAVLIHKNIYVLARSVSETEYNNITFAVIMSKRHKPQQATIKQSIDTKIENEQKVICPVCLDTPTHIIKSLCGHSYCELCYVILCVNDNCAVCRGIIC